MRLKLKLMSLVASTALLFNACSHTERIIYVDRVCPKLETYESDVKEHSPLDIKYRIIEKGKFYESS